MSPVDTSKRSPVPRGTLQMRGMAAQQLSFFDFLLEQPAAKEPPQCGEESQAEQLADADGAAAAAAAANAPQTLAEVLARLELHRPAGHYVSSKKSALRVLGSVLHRSLVDLPADPAQLRVLIVDAPYAAAGLTTKRWSRVRTLLMASLKECGIRTLPGRDCKGHSAEWGLLLRDLSCLKLRHGLSRFISFCSREGIAPLDISPSAFTGFKSALEEHSLNKNPGRIYRMAVRAWNEAARQSAHWPQFTIPIDRHRRFFALTLERFPPALRSELEAFLASRTEVDEFVRKRGLSPVKRSTASGYRKRTARIASLLVMSGIAVETISGLAVLSSYDNVERALRTLKAHNGGRLGVAAGHYAQLAGQFAMWSGRETEAADLRAMARRLTKPPKQMNTRNQHRLRQFDLPENVDAILQLPDQIFARARTENKGDVAEARRVAMALAVEILTVAPMRIANLAGLEPGRHIVPFGHRSQRRLHIYIPGEETKTGDPFEMMLPARTARLVAEYQAKYRPLLCATPSSFLFPNQTGSRRSPVGFSRAISALIVRETGIVMHAHLFRHFAGKLHLNAKPADIETVRRFLTHRSSATTTDYYAQQSMSRAFASYDATLEDLRNRDRRAPPLAGCAKSGRGG